MKQVKLFGITYDIEFCETVSRLNKLLGEINFLDQTIRIDGTLSDEKKEQVLIHEILHGICQESGLDELCCDEQKIQCIAAELHRVLRDNGLCLLKESKTNNGG